MNRFTFQCMCTNGKYILLILIEGILIVILQKFPTEIKELFKKLR